MSVMEPQKTVILTYLGIAFYRSQMYHNRRNRHIIAHFSVFVKKGYKKMADTDESILKKLITEALETCHDVTLLDLVYKLIVYAP